MRAYHINEKGNEITRMIAGQNKFIANFKNLTSRKEIIESITTSNVLMITEQNFDFLLKSSINIKCMYGDIMEIYNANNINHYMTINSSDVKFKLQYLKSNFPNVINNVNDEILASFINMSRETFVRHKKII